MVGVLRYHIWFRDSLAPNRDQSRRGQEFVAIARTSPGRYRCLIRVLESATRIPATVAQPARFWHRQRRFRQSSLESPPETVSGRRDSKGHWMVDFLEPSWVGKDAAELLFEFAWSISIAWRTRPAKIKRSVATLACVV